MSQEQKDFLEAPEKFVCGTGGFGSGKTIIGCVAMILLGNRVPKGQILVGRLNVPSLKSTTRKTFLELFPMEWLARKGDKSAEQDGGRIIHKNGTEFLFRHLDMTDPDHRAHIKSLNLNGYLVDQCEEITYETSLLLEGRLRRKTHPQALFGRYIANPNGQDWNYSTFFDPNREENIKKEHRGLIIPTTSNANLAPGVLDSMLYSYPADWKARYIEGSFADFSDLIYKDYDQRIHVYDHTRPHKCFNDLSDPPLDWPVIVGVDIGGVDPWAWVFIAVAPNGMLFQFDEIYISGILIRRLAEQYWAKLGERHQDGMAYDYENQQAALELAAENIGGAPANKSVKAGIFKVAQYLHPDERLLNPFTGLAPSPRYFVSSRCENTRRSLGMYKWGKDRMGRATGDPASSQDDHCPDAVRYAIHTFRPEPARVDPPRPWMNPALDEASRMYHYLSEKQDALSKGKTSSGGRRSQHYRYPQFPPSVPLQ